MPQHVTIGEHRITYADGKPFFLIGARHMPVGATPEVLRDAGFNAFRTLAFGHELGQADPIPSGLEGIYFWSYLYDRADFTKSPSFEGELRAKIGALRNHPGLLCYENYNEPTLLYKSTRFKAEPENLALGTALVRELDPHHPIWLAHNCGNTVETLQRFNDCLDVVGCNPYPVHVPGMRAHIGVRPDGRMLDCIDQSVHAVGKYTGKMMAVAAGRPVWMLIQALANENWFNPVHTPEYEGQTVDESKILYPTFEQMRFMAYDAIVSGATGLALSMNRTPASGDIWRDIKRLVRELSSLHDALCSPPLRGAIEVSYVDLGFSVWDGVRVLARRKQREVYLFAVNTAFDPAQVCMQLPCMTGSVGFVVGEEREIPVQDGRVRDHFAPYGVHVYRLSLKE